MARDYTLNNEAAKAAKESSQHSRRITESGLYAGKIKYAWGETNQKGNDLVNIIFVSDDGQECGPIQLYTHNAKGETLFGFGTLAAISICMRVKDNPPVLGPVTTYDFDAKAEVTRSEETFPALMGKPIGLVIQMEEYTGRNGVKHKPTIANSFEVSTRLVAAEILDKKAEPKLLSNVEKWLAQNPVKPERKRAAPAGTPPISNGTTGGNFEDDDIPF